ncbi:MAG: sulfatase-like hydrolase/transferase [Flavobacteriales bacterium]
MRASLRTSLALLKPLGVVLVLFTALRWVFFAVHHASFPALEVGQFMVIIVQGLRFDAMTITVANAVWIILCLLPVPWANAAWWRRSLAILFVVVNGTLLLLCCIDLPYYGFNGKRLTSDVLGQTGAGLRELPAMALNYWWTTLLFIGALFVVVRLARRPVTRVSLTPPMPPKIGAFVALAALLFLVGRGGWQYQGLSPAHAADHVGPAYAPLVTNSAFTFGYSLTEPPLKQHDWFDPTTLDRLMPLRYTIHGDTASRRPNVVLLIIESLGREYVGALNGGKGYTPFIDSLCGRSLVLSKAYANAERSNKSMCAILSGTPSFTDDAFMNTAYASNAVEGLGTRMKRIGYNTAFFHGGLNGEYKFDSFSRACGFDRYYGKDEFGHDEFYDGHWGIYDEEFLGFVADRLKELPQPFCAVEFTISSHDPFVIPKRYRGKFPSGGQEIHESLGYMDMSVRRFFERIREEPWFANSVFVITGDHTFQYNDHPPWYTNPAGRFAVPIIFYAPDGRFSGNDDRVAQHLDLLPSILGLAGYSGDVNTFGQSIFQRDRPNRAAIQLGGQYRLIEDDRLLLFDGEKSIGLYDYRTDTLCKQDLRITEPERLAEMTEEMKAMIQRHGEMLLHNHMVAQ